MGLKGNGKKGEEPQRQAHRDSVSSWFLNVWLSHVPGKHSNETETNSTFSPFQLRAIEVAHEF